MTPAQVQVWQVTLDSEFAEYRGIAGGRLTAFQLVNNMQVST
jgi:hypothetical protein